MHFKSTLTFKYNQKLQLNKSFKMLDFINRNIQSFKNIFCLIKLYCTLLMLLLKFDSLVWS